MNKSQLVDAIAGKAGISKMDARKSLDALISIAADVLKEGDKITLTGLGTFSVTKTKGRTGRNPRTGASIRIAPKNVVKFRPGSELSGYIQ